MLDIIEVFRNILFQNKGENLRELLVQATIHGFSSTRPGLVYSTNSNTFTTLLDSSSSLLNTTANKRDGSGNSSGGCGRTSGRLERNKGGRVTETKKNMSAAGDGYGADHRRVQQWRPAITNNGWKLPKQYRSKRIRYRGQSRKSWALLFKVNVFIEKVKLKLIYVRKDAKLLMINGCDEGGTIDRGVKHGMLMQKKLFVITI
ncbi:unnamed protein product [Lactuca virosa]|uniref:Uncharacterized protein n=1 Tax=Lactuca virosa TaxID=75947 RepID=A0AAU9M317_9ASTR|nr:unnamed protein product [Lactuca virosa]